MTKKFGGDDEDYKRYIIMSYMSMIVGVAIFMLLLYPVVIGINKVHVPDDFAERYSDGVSYKNIISKARILDIEFDDGMYSDMLKLTQISYEINEAKSCNWVACVIDADALYKNFNFDSFKQSYHKVNDFNDMLDAIAKNYNVDVSEYKADTRFYWDAIYNSKQEYLRSDSADRVVLMVFGLVAFFIVYGLYKIELIIQKEKRQASGAGIGMFILLESSR
jgi:hypothetical protein